MPRGGKRPGAGRHPKESKDRRVKIAPMVDPQTQEWLKSEAARRRVSQGRIIDELVEQGLDGGQKN